MRLPIVSGLGLLAALTFSFSPASAEEWYCPEASAGAACGLATCGDSDLTTSDARVALGAAIGSADCSLCRCDADDSGSVQATDALRILRAAVGQDVPLLCRDCNSLNITLTDRYLDPDLLGFARLKGGGIVGISVDGAELSSRLYDAELEPASDAEAFATSSSTPVSAVVACARPDGSFAAAWTAGIETDLPVPHDYPDPGNVEFALVGADGTSDGTFAAHAPLRGMQRPMAIACRADGGVTIAWSSRCYGLRELVEGEVTTYNPTCTKSAIYVRSFDANGAPVNDAGLVLMAIYASDEERVIAVPGGNLVASLYDTYVLLDGAGNKLMVSASYGYDDVRHDCSTGSERCVKFGRGHAWIHPSDDLGSGKGLSLKEAEYPDDPVWDIEISAKNGRLACGEDGICLAAWLLVEDRENYTDEGDYYDSIVLGIFGRAFNVFTGEAGPEVELPSTSIENAGPGVFLVGTEQGRRIMEVK